jgi:hypothetical protein
MQDQSSNENKPTEESQRFEAVTDRIFRVPIQEVRELEKDIRQAKKKKDTPQDSDD